MDILIPILQILEVGSI